MQAQWGRAVDSTPNGRRTYVATARVGSGLLTRGNAGFWDSGITRPSLNVDSEGKALPSVQQARRPWADLPSGGRGRSGPVIIKRQANLCSTCHMIHSYAECE